MAVNPLDFLKNMSSVKNNIDNIKRKFLKLRFVVKQVAILLLLRWMANLMLKKFQSIRNFLMI